MDRAHLSQRRPFHARLQVERLEERSLLSASEFVPNEVLVKFKDGVAEGDKANVRALAQTDKVEHIQTDAMCAAGYGGLELFHGPANIQATIARLKNDPRIAYAEPNWVYTHQAVSNDPNYTNGSLWGMYGPSTTPANQYGSQAGKAWAAGATGSNSVYVGIIDEGIYFDHPDLIGNVWNNPYETPGDGIDNDFNGYKDDVHGWDFDGNDNTIFDGTGDDHGTHVTGTIGARGGNAIGVAGVNWNVTYISGKFLGSRGGTTANAILAVDYMTDLKTRHGINIVATNNSWGGGGFSQGLLDAISRGANHEILFIAAAGNGGADGIGDNNDSVANYPSNYNTNAPGPDSAIYDAVIAVAAITSTGAKSSFSNYGAVTVDLGAPGSGIYSTVPVREKGKVVPGYASYSGTSMATPHVTGAAALYAATHPGATAAQIKAAILGSAIPTPSLGGKTVTGGRLNVGELGATFNFSAATYSVDEGGPTTTITVTRTGGSAGTVSVNYIVGGTATAGLDYNGVASGTLTFANGVTVQTFTISIVNDDLNEDDETVILTLNSVVGGGSLGTQNTTVLTMLDDDPMPSPLTTP